MPWNELSKMNQKLSFVADCLNKNTSTPYVNHQFFANADSARSRAALLLVDR
jgi:hypothetical protein